MDRTATKSFGLKHLVEASRRITTHLEMDIVLGQIAGLLVTELGALYSMVWIVERGDRCKDCELVEECLDKDKCLHLKAWEGPAGGSGKTSTRVPIGVMKIGSIGQSKIPHITNDALADPLLADPGWVRENGVRSFAGFPLVHGDKLLGVLGYYGDRLLEPELGDILSCFAHHAATAIADAKQFEMLRQSEEHYRALIDGAIDAVLIFGPDGGILEASRSACQLLSHAKEDLITMNMRDLDLANEAKVAKLLAELASGGALTYETAYTTKTGDHLPVEVRAGAIHYRGGVAVQAFVRDVSERKRLERQKADLISMITHDLKGPLSIILGYAEVINDQYGGSLPEFVKEGVRSIKQSGEKLLSMIDDYLSLSKMEAGMLPMEKAPVSLPSLLNRAMDTVVFKAEEKNLKLHASCPRDLPRVPADPKHLERAVVNLLSNAVKYTPRGGSITVTCGMDKEKRAVSLSVTDTGIGIPAEDIPKIFDKYYRSRKTGGKGTGLGLAIVKSVVEGHGGTVTVESEAGAGSTFTITLPLRY